MKNIVTESQSHINCWRGLKSEVLNLWVTQTATNFMVHIYQLYYSSLQSFKLNKMCFLFLLCISPLSLFSCITHSNSYLTCFHLIHQNKYFPGMFLSVVPEMSSYNYLCLQADETEIDMLKTNIQSAIAALNFPDSPMSCQICNESWKCLCPD